ncbi:MAG: 50S ribosomal protein L11 methyltransferase [Thermodesulfobacteriota bacterium]
MNRTACTVAPSSKNDLPARLVPGDHIFIYYLNGRADARRADLGPRFAGNWEEEDCSFLFFSAPAEEEMRRFLMERPTLSLVDRFDMPYQEWQPVEGFPLKAGGLSIFPPWETPDETADHIPLILDPGLVFGSGFHATTHDCLEALSLICYYSNRKIETAIDIGTGTGLLAVAAAMRGVARVIGVDNNQLAVETARHNVRLNNVDDRVLIMKGSALEPAYHPADLLMANIHCEVMEAIIETPVFSGCRWFILSGLLRTPARKIIARLNELSAEIIKVWNNDEIWYTVLGKRGEGCNNPVKR